MIEDEELTAAESTRLMDLIESPPAPPPKLIEAMRQLKPTETAPMHEEKREIAWIHLNGEWHPTVVLDGIPVKIEVCRQIGLGPLADAWGPRVPEPPWPMETGDVDRPVDMSSETAFLRGQWDAVRVDRARHAQRAWNAETECAALRDHVAQLRISMELILAGAGDAQAIAEVALRLSTKSKDILRSLSPEEQANVPPLTKEAIDAALARGRLDRLREEDARFGTQNAPREPTQEERNKASTSLTAEGRPAFEITNTAVRERALRNRAEARLEALFKISED